MLSKKDWRTGKALFLKTWEACMEKDIRITYTEFNNEAAHIFFSLFSKFRDEAYSIDRNGHENVFQVLRSKYVTVLQQRLEWIARNFIERCETAELQGRLRVNFAEKIRYLQKEFVRKSGTI